LLSGGMVDDPQKMLSELARLGARLIIERAVEEEFDTWLGRARYERRPERERGLRNFDSGLRNLYEARAGPARTRSWQPRSGGLSKAAARLARALERRDRHLREIVGPGRARRSSDRQG